ncbi:hypothetical protein H1P_360014 [Hyella patelloides LEGE 07179]|uniref:Uncharacterized protein n=1 Tax=Hyella patelloides LEGE 07179 TaxID=945734 RepID=A0A563VW50_9CYAN|nr:hypothetical protein H1P_360014 [Hyella patelloides LEGE 07179]
MFPCQKLSINPQLNTGFLSVLYLWSKSNLRTGVYIYAFF